LRSPVHDLIAAVRDAPNPFDGYKVSRAREAIIDVPEIHSRIYERLSKELEQVRKTGESRGVLIKGVAGSGKSHLLARLFQQRTEDVLFFQVEPLPGNAAGWLKHILQCIVQDLQHPAFPDTPEPQLTILIKHMMKGARGRCRSTGGTDFKALDKVLQETISRISREISDPLVDDILSALVNIWKWNAPFGSGREERQKKTALTIRWLKGCMIDQDELQYLGLTRNLGDDAQAGDQAYLSALRVIGMLTLGQAPIVLVFDQLDSMSDATMNSFGSQLLHLIGSDAAAPNYLIVTAGIQEQVEKFERENIIPQGAVDVLFKTELELPALQPQDCEKIVAKRMQTILTAARRSLLPPLAAGLFPFTAEYLRERLSGPIAPSPRRALKIARSAFDEIQEQISEQWIESWPQVKPLTDFSVSLPAPTEKQIEAFLNQELESLIHEARLTRTADPIDGDLLINILISLIELTGDHGPFQALRLPVASHQAPSTAFAAVCLRREPERSGVVLVENRGHWATVSAVLQRLVQFCNRFSRPEKVFFIRDRRAKPMDNWKQTQARLSELRQTGRLVQIDLDDTEVIELWAMNKLREEQPDLIIPSSSGHSDYQVEREDIARFFLQTNRTADRKPFREILQGLSQPPVRAGSRPPEVDSAKSFIYARVKVKKFYEYDKCLSEWVRHQGRVNPDAADTQIFQTAVEELVQERRLLPPEGGILKAIR